jgi:hypothetical protein
VSYYVESIRNNAFFARQCPSRDDINASRCNITPGAWYGNQAQIYIILDIIHFMLSFLSCFRMGGDGMNFSKSLRGSYYLETNNASPFGKMVIIYS